MNIVIISDAWTPQINGVVRTLQSVRSELHRMGHHVTMVRPDEFRSVPCPTYPEVRLALVTTQPVGRRIAAANPDFIHIATEGPLGFGARRWCQKQGLAFTTAFHTQFPDYAAKRTGLPASVFWPMVRRFHAPSSSVMTATESLRTELRSHGIHHLSHWGRGVDLDAFSPVVPPHPAFHDLERPIQLYVGRVAVEKNIEAFLETNHPGSKVIVGDGPALAMLEKRFP